MKTLAGKSGQAASDISSMLSEIRRDTEAMLDAQRRVVERIAQVDEQQRQAALAIDEQSMASRTLSHQAASSLEEIGAIDRGIKGLAAIS